MYPGKLRLSFTPLIGRNPSTRPSYQKSVRDCLPQADIVFDRFHVMQNYSKVINNQRRSEYRKADQAGKELLKGTRYLVLKNADKLTPSQEEKLHKLLAENTNLNTLYVLKEQLQVLWTSECHETMQDSLEQWCVMAEQTNMAYLVPARKPHKTTKSNAT